MAKNITRVYLMNCPLEADMQNTLYFANATAQQTYFQSIIGKTYMNVSYQSETNTFRCPDQLDTVRKYNYIMWQNTAYSNKWFYAFITKSEYVNDSLTDITFEVDVLQTFKFDYTVKPSFIEREHTNDDTIGKNTVPENLDLGEFEIVDHRNIPLYEGINGFVPCFCVTTLPEGCVGAVDGRVEGDNGLIGGVFSTLKFFAVSTVTAAKKVIEAYDNGNVTSDAIINVYMVPWCCVNSSDQTPTTLNGYSLYPLYNYYVLDDNGVDYKLTQPNVLAENYTPINNKLFTAPFSYIYMSNNVGNDVTLNWEDFPLNSSNKPTMSYYKYMVPSSGLSAKLIFRSYKTYTSNASYATQMMNYGINYGKLPVCAWTTDYYTNWLTQNGVNVGTSFGSSIASMGVGVGLGLATGGIGLLAAAGSAVSGLSSIASTMGEMHKASTVPDQAHGDTATGDAVFALKINSISCYFMSIRKEYAERIDSYFNMFGYKTNKLKTPNVAHRQNWWYTKTVNANITGNIPNDYMDRIKQAYNNGFTTWRTPANFLNYSVSNGIV